MPRVLCNNLLLMTLPPGTIQHCQSFLPQQAHRYLQATAESPGTAAAASAAHRCMARHTHRPTNTCHARTCRKNSSASVTSVTVTVSVSVLLLLLAPAPLAAASAVPSSSASPSASGVQFSHTCAHDMHHNTLSRVVEHHCVHLGNNSCPFVQDAGYPWCM